MAEHHFDSVGVCILCGTCDDVDCCRQAIEECDQRLSAQLKETWQKLRSRQGDRTPTPEGTGT